MKTKFALTATVLTAALFGVGCASSSLDKGLVAYYPFNGNAKDESGNGLNGKPVGATLCADRHGKANAAYIMNGLHYILLPKDKAFDLQQHTLAAWVRIGDFDSRSENSKKRW